MGWTSYNDFINLTTNSGTIGNAIWQKSFGAATGVAPFPSAGRWYNMGYYQGNPMVSRYGERLLNGYGQFMGNANGWTLNGIYWTYASNTIVCAIGGTATATIMPTNMTAGARYGIEFTLSNYSGSGNFVVSLGGTTAATVAANGTYFQVIVTSNNTGPLTITPAATVGGSFSNISVVQMDTGVPLMSTDMGALQVGGTVSPSTKHIVFAGLAAQNANMVPGTWKLVDVLMSYPIDMNLVGFQNLVPIGGNYSVAFQNGAGAWTYGSGWAYSSATTVTASSTSGSLTLPIVNFSAGNTGGPVYHAVNATTGLPYTYTYNITFTISSLTGSGSITFGIGGAITTIVLANGNYTNFITPINSTDGITFSTTGVNSFSLSNLSVTVSLPRYSNGVGVRPMLCWHSGGWQLASNATSAVAHNIQMTYTNSSNTIGQSLPTIISGLSGAVPAMGHIDHSGTAVNNFGPYLPLSSGDSGVQSVQSFQISAATGTNNYAELILCKELFTLPTSTPASLFAAAAERDFLNQVRTLPNIQDGANLQWVFFTGAGAGTAASQVASGNFKYSWG